jgi:lysophospholipase L1-like esterase
LRRAAGNTLLVLASLAVFLALGEAATRLAGGIRYGGWGDPASIRLVMKQMALNSRGLRDREIPHTRAPGEFRILCLGDSFTWGQMVARDEAFPKVIERALSASATPERSFTVINAGSLGSTTVDEAMWLAREGVRYHPDIVVVGFFLNDPESRHYAIRPLLPARVERLLKDSYFYFFLKYRVHLLRVRFGLAQGYDDYLRGLYAPDGAEWRRCRRALLAVRDTARAAGAGVLVVVLPVITDWSAYPFEAIHDEVVGFCESEGIPVADALGAFRASPIPWKDLRVGAHDEHPNAAGHEIIARVALEALRAHFRIP